MISNRIIINSLKCLYFPNDFSRDVLTRMNKNICSTSGKFLNHTNFRFILHATRDDIKRKQFCQFSLNDKRISSEILRTNECTINFYRR